MRTLPNDVRLAWRALRLATALAIAAGPAFADTLLVANKAEATLSLIDLVTGQVSATLPTGLGPHEVGLSPDGRRALVSNYGTRDAPGASLSLVDLAAARLEATIDLGAYRRPHGVVWLDSRRALVTAEGSGALLEIDVTERRVLRAVVTAQEVSHMVAASGDGRRAFVANIGSGSITAVDLATGAKLADVPTGEGAEGIAWVATPAGGEVWVTNRSADTVTVLDAATLARRAEVAAPGFPIRATATPDGRSVLVTRAAAGDLAVYDTAARSLARTVSFDRAALPVSAAGKLFGDRFGDSTVPIGVVVDGDGRRAWVAHAHADAITEIDISTGRTLRVLRAGREPDGMAWSPVPAPAAPAEPGD